MEALSWLKYNKNREFAANAFSRTEALSFIKKLYKLGITRAEIESFGSEPDYSDRICLSLPASLSARLDIVSFIFSYRWPDEITSHEEYVIPVKWKIDKKVYLWWD